MLLQKNSFEFSVLEASHFGADLISINNAIDDQKKLNCFF
jgi:hypothetical protein